MEYLAEFFKVLGDSTRLRILNELLVEEECGVSQIANNLDMSISAISHQLKVLKTHRLIKNKKVGKEVFYSLDDDHVQTILEMGITHLSEGQ